MLKEIFSEQQFYIPSGFCRILYSFQPFPLETKEFQCLWCFLVRQLFHTNLLLSVLFLVLLCPSWDDKLTHSSQKVGAPKVLYRDKMMASIRYPSNDIWHLVDFHFFLHPWKFVRASWCFLSLLRYLTIRKVLLSNPDLDISLFAPRFRPSMKMLNKIGSRTDLLKIILLTLLHSKKYLLSLILSFLSINSVSVLKRTLPSQQMRFPIHFEFL